MARSDVNPDEEDAQYRDITGPTTVPFDRALVTQDPALATMEDGPAKQFLTALAIATGSYGQGDWECVVRLTAPKPDLGPR